MSEVGSEHSSTRYSRGNRDFDNLKGDGDGSLE